MTVERASEIVMYCPSPHKLDLFEHFVRYFNIINPFNLELFAELCGFEICIGME